MNIQTYALSRPESLHISNEDESVSFGLNQEWYGTNWQRRAGCGPTVASTVLLYLNKVKGMPLPHSADSKAGCVGLMESVWEHVTPTMNGVNRLEILSEGVLALADCVGAGLSSHLLHVPTAPCERPDLSHVVAFIAEGLRQDCPVAFLNLSNGKLHNLDDWHWVTIVSLEVGEDYQSVQAVMYDEGKSTQIDLKLWVETTLLGGGFVYFTAPARQD